jgi:hypothetical protein
MSNYYKTVTINGTPTAISLDKIIKTTKFTSDQTSFVNIGVPNNTSSDFTNTVTETPNLLNYQINGVDIAEKSIAYWVEGTQANGSISVPSWATKIRAVLIGAGGSGGQNNLENNNQIIYRNISNNHNNQDFSEHQTNNEGITELQYQITNDAQLVNYDRNQNPQYNNNTQNNDQVNQQTEHYQINCHNNYGAGGGGGAFLYLSDIIVEGNSNIICNSQKTELQNNNLSYIAGAGNNGGCNTQTTQSARANGGSGGTITVTAPTQSSGISSNGGSGTNVAAFTTVSTTFSGGESGGNNYIINETIKSYGKGGNSRSSGNSGYYRIYFLTN